MPERVTELRVMPHQQIQLAIRKIDRKEICATGRPASTIVSHATDRIRGRRV